MNKIDKHIETIRAGSGSFNPIGSKTSIKMQDILSKRYKHVGVSAVNTVSDLEEVIKRQPDLLFLRLKRIHDNDESTWVSEYLDAHCVNYTGSEQPAMQLDLDKAEAKLLMQRNNIATASFFTCLPGQYLSVSDMPLAFPLFIKPLRGGGGKGIGADSVVHNYVEFKDKVQAIFSEFGSEAIVEQYLTGREFSVAILEDPNQDEPLVMPVEIITEKNSRGDRLLGHQVKKEDNEQVIAVEDVIVKNKISVLAKDIYGVLGARDLGRIDIRMDSTGEPHFIEANLLPGLGNGYFMRACQINMAMDYETTILHIIELGLARSTDALTDLLEPEVPSIFLKPILQT